MFLISKSKYIFPFVSNFLFFLKKSVTPKISKCQAHKTANQAYLQTDSHTGVHKDNPQGSYQRHCSPWDSRTSPSCFRKISVASVQSYKSAWTHLASLYIISDHPQSSFTAAFIISYLPTSLNWHERHRGLIFPKSKPMED